MGTNNAKKILVVDDSSTMRMLITMTIKKVLPGLAVSEAVNGADAREQLKHNAFDLVLTDMKMPEMDGFELVAWIKDSLDRDLPIVMITTIGEEKEKDRGRALGINEYLTKPVDSHKLRDSVNRLLNSA